MSANSKAVIVVLGLRDGAARLTSKRPAVFYVGRRPDSISVALFAAVSTKNFLIGNPKLTRSKRARAFHEC